MANEPSLLPDDPGPNYPDLADEEFDLMLKFIPSNLRKAVEQLRSQFVDLRAKELEEDEDQRRGDAQIDRWERRQEGKNL